MTQGESPITRSELREELQHYATKADMAQMETRLVKWMVGIMFGAAALSASIALVIERLTN